MRQTASIPLASIPVNAEGIDPLQIRIRRKHAVYDKSMKSPASASIFCDCDCDCDMQYCASNNVTLYK